MQTPDPAAETRYAYSIFGLTVASELELPELVPADPGAAADLLIRVSVIPEGQELGTGVHSIAEGVLLVIEGTARYLMAAGREIVIEAEAGAAAQDIRLYLLGSALGLLIQQRGLLPLHANAVEIDGRAVAFMGRSGEGKSTLAAWLHDHGHRVIADDVCVVTFDDDGRALALRGLPRLRLWGEALEATGRDPADYSRSAGADEDWDKYDVPLPHERLAAEHGELAVIYLLDSGSRFEIVELTGAEAARAVIENTYRGAHLLSAGDPRQHWQLCMDLVDRVPVFRAARTRDLSAFRDQAERMLAHAQQVVPPNSSP